MIQGRVPELDGLRGLAALSVVVAHYFGEVPHGIQMLTVGWVGVDVFFVLSGYLIAGILLDHQHSPGVVGTFYARRIFRIFPIYYLTISLVLFFAATHNKPWLDVPYPAAVYFTYTQNIWMVAVNGQSNIWLLPAWTLAVEEQFYLLLPLLILRTPKRWFLSMILLAIATAPALRAVILATHVIPPVGALALLPCRWDLLFLGVLAAYVVRSPELWRRVTHRRPMLRLVCIAGPWAIIGDAYLGDSASGAVLHLVTGICAASYILLMRMGGSEGRFLAAPWLGRVGAISYGLYLIHQPISGLIHGFLLDARPDIGSLPSLLVTILAILASVGVAWLSWVWIETPLIRFGRRWSYPQLRQNTTGLIPVV
jgi:peptidoglycan/LPS O-acetylase OafA/YrhL